MKSKLLLGLFLLMATLAVAQSTSVTLNVTDTDTQPWINGTWQASLVPTPGSVTQPPFVLTGSFAPVPNVNQSGALDGSANAAITLTPNASIGGSTIWRFTVCPNVSAPCYTQSVTIIGVAQTVNLVPPAIRISMSGIPFRVTAYSDLEVVNGPNGSVYYNVLAQNLRVCTNTLICNGSGWTVVGASSSFPVLTPQFVTGPGSLTTTNAGQIFASGSVLSMGVPYASASITSTSGGFLGGSGFNYLITYNTVLGETYPSATQSLNMSTCGGSACQVTIVAPVLPAGVTGYTAYTCNIAACTPLRQNANPNCVNITTNCVVLAAGLGAGAPTANTAWVQPPNVQANTCPPGTIPLWFIQDSNANFQTLAGVDEFSDNTNGPVAPGGWLTFCRRIVVTDTQQSPPQMKNSLLNINHLFSATNPNTSLGNQDRAVGIISFNSSSDAAAHYSFTGLQDEVDVFGTPSFSVHIDGEISAGSFQTVVANTNAMTGPALGATGLRSTIQRGGSGTMGGCPNSDCYTALQATSFNNNNSATNGAFVGIMVTVTDGTGGSGANAVGKGIHFITPGVSRLGGQNYAIDIQDYGTNLNDFNINSEATTGLRGKNLFQGAMIFGSNVTNQFGTWWTNTWVGVGNITTKGAFGVSSQIAAPPAPTLNTVGTPGATSYTYAVVAIDANGNPSPGPTATKATGNAVLGGGNNIQIQWSTTSSPGTDHFAIYRTASGGTPSSTGLIGTSVSCVPDPGGGIGFACGAALYSFTDTGLAGDGTTLPPANTTGTMKGFKWQTLTNCAANGTAANPSVVSCGSASAGAFSCATNASTGTCTVNTTAIITGSEVLITPSAADGTLLGVTCNTTADTPTGPRLATKVAGTSFTINLGTVATNPTCYEYHIVN